ncbi:MAG: hypothetical protein L6Q38_10895, partial [Nitrospira sp.]|nr:hypothetical protein [Nitrospira sp.]
RRGRTTTFCLEAEAHEAGFSRQGITRHPEGSPSLRLLLDPAAKAELSQAALFYEDCREGLGEEFLVAVEAAFNQIRNIRPFRAPSREDSDGTSFSSFPYGVIYALEGQTIYVAAVMHLRRKPGYWVSRKIQ